MIELAYTSTTSWIYSPGDLTKILEVSRANNAAHGITGILLYKSGAVMQILEGEADAVHFLYRKLLADSRHHSVTKLYERPLAARNFPEWSMGFESLEPSQPGLADVRRISQGELIPEVSVPPRVRRLLDTFLTNIR